MDGKYHNRVKQSFNKCFENSLCTKGDCTRRLSVVKTEQVVYFKIFPFLFFKENSLLELALKTHNLAQAKTLKLKLGSMCRTQTANQLPFSCLWLQPPWTRAWILPFGHSVSTKQIRAVVQISAYPALPQAAPGLFESFTPTISVYCGST